MPKVIRHILSIFPRKTKSSGTHVSSVQATWPVSTTLNRSKSGDFLTNKNTSLPSTITLFDHGEKPIQMLDPKTREDGSISIFYEQSPRFQDVHGLEKHNLFIRKLNVCCNVFDFSDPTKNLKEKEIKQKILLEIAEYISSVKIKFTENEIEVMVRMVSANLFRAHISQQAEGRIMETFLEEEEEPFTDPAWPHLQLVYESFLRFIASPELDITIAKKFIDESFVLKLLQLFDSEDHREREYLKTILHKIYGKFMVHRLPIRKAMNNIFYDFIFETEKHNGMAEILEILGSIINGFVLPLKEEHKLFLAQVLIPLHGPRFLPLYHRQLTYCMIQFLEKDQALGRNIARGILKYWPVTHSSKEVLFIGEVEEVLEVANSNEFRHYMVPLFKQIARCLCSTHFQVAERAFSLFDNGSIMNLVKENKMVILPIIVPSLERNSKAHWNHAIQKLTVNTRKTLSDLDPPLFKDCLKRFKEQESKQEEIQAKRDITWRKIQEIAASRSPMPYPTLLLS